MLRNLKPAVAVILTPPRRRRIIGVDTLFLLGMLYYVRQLSHHHKATDAPLLFNTLHMDCCQALGMNPFLDYYRNLIALCIVHAPLHYMLKLLFHHKLSDWLQYLLRLPLRE